MFNFIYFLRLYLNGHFLSYSICLSSVLRKKFLWFKKANLLSAIDGNTPLLQWKTLLQWGHTIAAILIIALLLCIFLWSSERIVKVSLFIDKPSSPTVSKPHGPVPHPASAECCDVTGRSFLPTPLRHATPTDWSTCLMSRDRHCGSSRGKEVVRTIIGSLAFFAGCVGEIDVAGGISILIENAAKDIINWEIVTTYFSELCTNWI